MRTLATILVAVAVVCLVLGVIAHFGVSGLRELATPTGYLRLADTVLLLTIALLLGELVARKQQSS